jgi:hypothetical protein
MVEGSQLQSPGAHNSCEVRKRDLLEVPGDSVCTSVALLYLTGVWLGEDQRTNTIKTHFKKRMDYIFSLINYSTINSEGNWQLA